MSDIITTITPGAQINVEIVGTGPKGDKGDTPIKGIDYFTPQEIEDFINTIKQSTYFFYQQELASTVWNITHNLSRFPSVTTVTDNKNIVIGEVEYIDENQLIITFSAPFSGYAYIN